MFNARHAYRQLNSSDASEYIWIGIIIGLAPGMLIGFLLVTYLL